MIEFILTSLAAHRITLFITSDTMPFERVRSTFLRRWGNSIYADGLTCARCMGAWVSFALVGALAQIRDIPLPGLYALAVASTVIVIARYTED